MMRYMAQQELSRRKTEHKYKYLQLHSGQQRFTDSQKKIRLLIGGNRSGKTTVGAREAILIAKGEHPYWSNIIPVPNIGWIVSLDLTVGLVVAKKKLMELLPSEDIKTHNKKEGHIILNNGSEMWFKSCESSWKKFQGASIHYCWMDEEPPEDIFKEVLVRVTDTRGCVWITMTPVMDLEAEDLSWTYYSLYLHRYSNADLDVIQMSTYDNIDNLPREEILKLENTFSHSEKQARLEGKYSFYSKLVYKNFISAVCEPFDIPPEWTRYRSIDWGINSPTCCLWGAVSPDNVVYIYREYYQTDCNVKQNSDNIIRLSGGENYNWTVIDSKATNRSCITGTTIQQEYMDCGIPTILGEKDVQLGVARVQELLGREKLKVFSSCYQLIDEARHYRFLRRDTISRRIRDDGMDSLRFLLMSNPYYVDSSKKRFIGEMTYYKEKGVGN